MNKAYLQVLRQSPEFQELMKEIKTHAPVIPYYDYQTDNTKEWQALSHKRLGFEMVLTLLGEEL